MASTFDGMALAFAICRHLVEKNRAMTLFATHYFELTLLANEYPQLANVHLDAIEHGEIVFLHAVEEQPIRATASRSPHWPYSGVSGQGGQAPAARVRTACLDQPLAARPVRSAQPPIAAANNPALERLTALDPETLTPRQAPGACSKLKSLLQQDG